MILVFIFGFLCGSSIFLTSSEQRNIVQLCTTVHHADIVYIIEYVDIVLTLCMIKHVDIVQSSNGGDLELCFNNCYELCGHCMLSNMWTLYIVQHVDIVYCQICGQLDIVQIVLTLCTIKHVDIVQSSNGCDLELCFNNRYELCGHCILSNMWKLYIVKYVDNWTLCRLCWHRVWSNMWTLRRLCWHCVRVRSNMWTLCRAQMVVIWSRWHFPHLVAHWLTATAPPTWISNWINPTHDAQTFARVPTLGLPPPTFAHALRHNLCE